MKVFISGATGYVGRNLAKYLTPNHEVVGLSRDINKSAYLETLGINIFEGDLHSKNIADGLLGCEAIIHTAADTDHKNISKTQYETNVIGTELLVNAAKKTGVKRFIHLSTESVLLTGKPLHLVTENMSAPLNPVGSYSATKLQAEELVLKASDDQLEVIVLRPRFIWGRDDTTAIPQILEAISRNQFAWIDDGNYLTSTTHIENLCYGIECALSNGRSGEIYFLSDDDNKTFKEMMTALVNAHGSSVPEKSIPRAVLFVIAKLDNIRRKIAPRSKPLPITMQEFATSAVEVTLDITKAKMELGYKPVMSFQKGLLELKKYLM